MAPSVPALPSQLVVSSRVKPRCLSTLSVAPAPPPRCSWQTGTLFRGPLRCLYFPCLSFPGQGLSLCRLPQVPLVHSLSLAVLLGAQLTR